MANQYMLKGIMAGAQRASETLLNVSLKKRQLEKEDKQFSIGMKIKKLELEALQEKMSPEQLEYNKTLQSLEIKDQKLKTEKTTLELDKARKQAEFTQGVMESFAKGAQQGEADGIREGFEFAGKQYDLGLTAGGDVSYKETKATDKVKKREAEEKLAGFEHFDKAKERAETYFKSVYTDPKDSKVKDITLRVVGNIKTAEDLKGIKDDRDELEEAGVDVDEILRYFGASF